MHKFQYNWKLSEANFTKDKGTVFSCFSCGGGSTMGYKLAGYDVIGCNEIDKHMMEVYIKNHNPKYPFLMPIQEFKDLPDLPDELFNLDILDGSPPCTTFSMNGLREDSWGVEKKYNEGKTSQVLDTLFFDFIDLAKRLQPKVVIAENVTGLLMGNAKDYVRRIYREFNMAGYSLQHFVLDASEMGVPQKRKRVFFIGMRKDLLKNDNIKKSLFSETPIIDMKFNEPVIPLKDFMQEIEDDDQIPISSVHTRYWHLAKKGQSFNSLKETNGSQFSHIRLDENKPFPTMTTKNKNFGMPDFLRHPNKFELMCGCSWPMDYDFCGKQFLYVMGMSVPPLMTAQISDRIYNQWLKYFQ